MIALASMAVPVIGAQARQVYVDDSVAAAQTLIRVGELARSGVHAQAARTLQDLLDASGDRLIVDEQDDNKYASVRSSVIDLLRADPALLDAYLLEFSDVASALVDLGMHEAVAERYWMTEAGLRSTLWLAQRALIGGDVATAWVRLEEASGHLSLAGELRASHDRLSALVAREIASAHSADGAHEGIDPATLLEILPKPVLTRELGRVSVQRLEGEGTPGVPLGRPIVVDDTVYATALGKAWAWDRLSLTPIWSTPLRARRELPAESSALDGSAAGASTPPAVAWPTVVVIEDRAPDGTPVLPAVHALDARNGASRWSVVLGELGDDRLADAMAGPPVISGGVVLVPMVRRDLNFRGISTSVVALDLSSGRIRWARTIASSTQFVRFVSQSMSPRLTIVGGRVYVNDPSGVVTCIGLSTGRVRWLRTLDRAPVVSLPSLVGSAAGPPVIDGSVFVTLPRRRQLIELDADTGSMIGRPEAVDAGDRARGRIEQPIAVGGGLLIPSSGGVVWLALDGPGEAGRRDLRWIRAPDVSLNPPPMVSGEVVLFSTGSGLRIVDVSSGVPVDVGRVELHRMGEAAAAPGGAIITIDDEALHSFLVWDDAERLLSDRMRANPGEADLGITLAEAASRAGSKSDVERGIDHAVRAIEADPFSPETTVSRDRLASVLIDLITSEGSGAGSADSAHRLRLLEAFGRIEDGPAARAGRLLLAGMLAERRDDPERAIEHYTEILGDPSLLSVELPQGIGRAFTPGAEARQRIAALIRVHGIGVYEPWEIEAGRRIDVIEQEAHAGAPERYKAIARQYPLTLASIRAWTLAGDRHRELGQLVLARHCYEQAITSAREAGADASAITRSVERLTETMVRQGELLAAGVRLEQLRLQWDVDPFVVEIDGERVTGGKLEARARDRAMGPALPEAGIVGDAARGMESLEIEPVVSFDPGSVVLTDRRDDVSVWRQTERGPAFVWVAPADVKVEALFGDGALVRASNRDGPLTMIELPSGDRRWSASVEFPALDRAVRDKQFTAERRLVRLREVTVTPTETTVLAVRRDGSLIALDRHTGEMLWRDGLALDSVHGVLPLSGLGLVYGSRDLETSSEADRLIAFDLRSGEVILRADFGEAVRWVVPTVQGWLIVSTAAGPVALNPFSGERHEIDLSWPGEPEPRARRVTPGGRVITAEREWESEVVLRWAYGLPGAWVLHEAHNTLFVIDPARVVLEPPGDSHKMIVLPLASIEIGQMVGPRALLAGEEAVVVVGPDAELELMHRDPSAGWLEPAFSRTHLYVLSGQPEGPVEVGVGARYRLETFELETARLVDVRSLSFGGGERPVRLAVIDGALVVSTGASTSMLDAPAGARDDR